MKKGIVWTAVALVVVGVIFWATSSNNPASQPQQGQGRLVVAVTDAAADIQNVSEIKMEVSSVELHSQTEGWVTVTTSNHEYSLLKLRDQNRWELAAQENIKAGSYDQLRLMVSGVTVVKTDGSTATAKLPSGELKIMTDVTVRDQETATVGIDVKGDASLHLTGNGKYIFAPVVHVESRANAEATVAADNGVTISGGTVRSVVNAGMDVSGEVRNNFQLDTNTKLDIDASGVIKINSVLNGGVNVGVGGSGSAATNSQGGSTNSGSVNGNTNINVGGGVKVNY